MHAYANMLHCLKYDEVIVMRTNHAAELSQMLLHIANFKGVGVVQQDLRYEQYREFCRSLVDFARKHLRESDAGQFNELSIKLLTLKDTLEPSTVDARQEKMIEFNQNLNRYVAKHFPPLSQFEGIQELVDFLRYFLSQDDSKQVDYFEKLIQEAVPLLNLVEMPYESAAAPISLATNTKVAVDEVLIGRAAAVEVERQVGVAVSTVKVSRRLDFEKNEQAKEKIADIEEKIRQGLKIDAVMSGDQVKLGG
ncbi:MAG TPA: hypothetical protein VD770_01115, partial [Coxiellaceae bacterium]|nr:hypothetical protein [Coxiellaceae bacterium]